MDAGSFPSPPLGRRVSNGSESEMGTWQRIVRTLKCNVHLKASRHSRHGGDREKPVTPLRFIRLRSSGDSKLDKV